MRHKKLLRRRAAAWGSILLLLMMLSVLAGAGLHSLGTDPGARAPLTADDGSKTDPDFG